MATGGEAMGAVKKQAIEMIKSMPDDCSYEDIQYRLYVCNAIEEGLRDAEAGRVMSHAEAMRRMDESLKSFGQRKGSRPSKKASSTSRKTRRGRPTKSTSRLKEEPAV
jgi:predicted transcriptional regulator